MGADSRRTVAEGTRIAFEIRGSRFIGQVAPAESVEAADAIIEGVAADHPDATHVVSAYRIATEPTTERADDAGEPGGSAGQPALGVLRTEGLVDVVAVVVRYYGGTNLGYGGLVRAYARAVRDAIPEATVVEHESTATLDVEVGYDDSGTVRSVLESEGLEFEASYDETVTFAVTTPRRRLDAVIGRLRSATSDRASLDRSDISNRK